MQFSSIQLRQYFPSTVGVFFSPPPTPCPTTLQIIKKQKSKTEQAEADFEWPPSRSSGLASVAVSDQSMLTFPGSRRGSYTLWVSDWAQLLTFAAAQNWKMGKHEEVYLLPGMVRGDLQTTSIKPVSGQTVAIMGHGSRAQTLCGIGERVGED